MSGKQGDKALRLVAAFPTATAAMAMEKACREESLPGRLIPTPRAVSASCGLAWCAPPEARDGLENLAGRRAVPVEGWYYVML